MKGKTKRPVVLLKPGCTEESEPVEMIPIDPDARYMILVRGEFYPGAMRELCCALDEWWKNDKPFFVFGAGDQDVEFHKVTKGIEECPETIETN